MKRVTLGNSNLMVTPICVGCMSFGDATSHFLDWTLNESDSETVIKHALENDLNFFDTANVYSGGTSEEYLGRILKKLGVQRDQVVLASKVYFNEGHLSRKAILREIEGTLRRLQTDYLDLYIIHRFDVTTPMEETMEALHQLVVEGKVRALGASAMYGYQFYNLQMTAKDNGWTRFVSMQDHYNLLYREDEREMIPICDQMNVARTPYSPLASGRLARNQWASDSKRSQTDKTAAAKYDAMREPDTAIVQRVGELATKHDLPMSVIALAWQYAKGVTAPIIGANKTRYLDDAVAALSIQLTTDEIAFLEEPYVAHPIVGALPNK